jgi:SpoVK/Ycf46/Vps4 family AAA+-type ATPase
VSSLPHIHLVLTETHKVLLKEIVAALRKSALMPDGMGMSPPKVLFTGLDREAKTIAAETLARELGRHLLRVDLNSIVSKYIGETEKNLRRVFAAATANDAILFFDEADALFGKRSDVKDSHDRFANLEVSYLLQLWESHHGIAILSTDTPEDIDPAARRRFRSVLKF